MVEDREHSRALLYGGADCIHEGYTRDPVTSLALLILLLPRLWSYDVNLGDSAYRGDMGCPEHGEASFPRADPSAVQDFGNLPSRRQPLPVLSCVTSPGGSHRRASVYPLVRRRWLQTSQLL